jgi:hypothetical protein
MKKLFIISILFSLFKIQAQCTWNFTLFSLSGNFSITCASPTVQLITVNSNSNNINFLWTGPSFTATGSNVDLAQPGPYTVVATDVVTSCSLMQTFIVGTNTIVPSNTISPSTMSTACGGGSPVSFTASAISPTVNVQHNWYSPYGYQPIQLLSQQSNNTSDVFGGNYPPGIYTVQTIDLNNGCKTIKTFTISSTGAFPAFIVASPTDFSIGCAPLNQTTISILNPISTQTPPATCSYTFLSPGFMGVVTPSVIFSANTSTIINTPGTWTIIVEDNYNWCRTAVPVIIASNTAVPNVMASMFTQTLTCNTPTVLATGTSTTPNASISWLMPVTPPSLSSSTLMIGIPPTGPVPAPNPLFYSNFTVVATNTINSCQSISVVPIYQNFKPPVSIPAILSPGFICDGFAQLTTGNSTVTSGVPGASVYPFLWEGPSPQSTLASSPVYNAYSQGIYSLTVQDSYNGCLKTGTINVNDSSPLFTLQGIAPSSSVSCNGTVVISPTVNAGYTISVDIGTLTGTPQNTINNLCYGILHVCLTYTATGCKKCDSLVIDGFTGIFSNNEEDRLLLYPNPVLNSFMIRNIRGPVTLKLFSSDGRMVKDLNVEKDSNIEVSDLREGIYFAVIGADYGVVRKKLVVHR